MSITVQNRKSKQLTVFAVAGRISFIETMKAIESFFEGEPTENILWDFRNAESRGAFSLRETEHMADFIRRRLQSRTNEKKALMTSRGLALGFCECIKYLRRSKGICTKQKRSYTVSADEAPAAGR